MEGFDLGGRVLPELPSLESLKQTATERRDFFQGVVDRAQAEVDKAQAVLDGLSGRPKGRRAGGKKRQPTMAETSYRAILDKLGAHAYAGTKTLASASGFGSSHVNLAMRIGQERGHVAATPRGRTNRYSLTEAGQEFVTNPMAADHDRQ